MNISSRTELEAERTYLERGSSNMIGDDEGLSLRYSQGAER